MFKFGTTTIINSNEDFCVKGSPLFTGQEATTSESGRDIPANFFVKRGLKFYKPNTLAIYVRRHNDPEYAQVRVDLSDITEAGVYRIAMYISLEGSANSYYANDYVFKGKPFFIEFEKTDHDSGTMTLAERVVKIAKKYMQMVYEMPLIKVTNEGNTLIFDATDEYQRFAMVELQVYNPEKGLPQSCCASAGAFEVIDTLKEDSPKNNGHIVFGTAGGKELKGKQGFGTYRHLIKDLRLPTGANRRWEGINQDEVVNVGSTYDEYVIYYCTTVGVQGLAHVGDIVKAATRHIFYVNTNLTNDWEAALASIGTPVEVVGDGTYTPSPLEIAAKKDAEAATSQASTDSSQTEAIAAAQASIADLEQRVAALEA